MANGYSPKFSAPELVASFSTEGLTYPQSTPREHLVAILTSLTIYVFTVHPLVDSRLSVFRYEILACEHPLAVILKRETTYIGFYYVMLHGFRYGLAHLPIRSVTRLSRHS